MASLGLPTTPSGLPRPLVSPPETWLHEPEFGWLLGRAGWPHVSDCKIWPFLTEEPALQTHPHVDPKAQEGRNEFVSFEIFQQIPRVSPEY